MTDTNLERKPSPDEDESIHRWIPLNSQFAPESWVPFTSDTETMQEESLLQDGDVLLRWAPFNSQSAPESWLPFAPQRNVSPLLKRKRRRVREGIVTQEDSKSAQDGRLPLMSDSDSSSDVRSLSDEDNLYRWAPFYSVSAPEGWLPFVAASDLSQDELSLSDEDALHRWVPFRSESASEGWFSFTSDSKSVQEGRALNSNE